MERIGYVKVMREHLVRLVDLRSTVGIEEIDQEWHVVLRVDIDIKRLRDRATAEQTAIAMCQGNLVVLNPNPVVGRVFRPKHVHRTKRIRVFTVRFEEIKKKRRRQRSTAWDTPKSGRGGRRR